MNAEKEVNSLKEDCERLTRSVEDEHKRRLEAEAHFERSKTSYETQLACLRTEKERLVARYDKELQGASEKAARAERKLAHAREIEKSWLRNRTTADEDLGSTNDKLKPSLDKQKLIEELTGERQRRVTAEETLRLVLSDLFSIMNPDL